MRSRAENQFERGATTVLHDEYRKLYPNRFALIDDLVADSEADDERNVSLSDTDDE